MAFIKQSVLLSLMIVSCLLSAAQIEVNQVSMPDFNKTGFGAFANFSIPIFKVNYLTAEGGLQYYANKNNEDLTLMPVTAGYRYTINQTGKGMYIEPNAGYTFGTSTVQVHDKSGAPVSNDRGLEYHHVAGPVAGLNIGYLFEPTGIFHFNIALRYQRTFGNTPTNVVGLRLAHSINLGKQNSNF